MGSYRLAAPGQVQSLTAAGLTAAAPAVTAQGRTLLYADYEGPTGPGLLYADTASGAVRCCIYGSSKTTPLAYALVAYNRGSVPVTVRQERSASATGAYRATGAGVVGAWWSGKPATFTIPAGGRKIILSTGTNRSGGGFAAVLLWDATTDGPLYYTLLAFNTGSPSSGVPPTGGSHRRGTLQGCDVTWSVPLSAGHFVEVGTSPATLTDALTGQSVPLVGDYALFYTINLDTSGSPYSLWLANGTPYYNGFVQVAGAPVLFPADLDPGRATPLCAVTPPGTLQLSFLVAPGSNLPVRFIAPGTAPGFGLSGGSLALGAAGAPPTAGVRFNWTPVALIGGIGAAGAASVVAVERHRASA
jgi:hypothetical protein